MKSSTTQTALELVSLILLLDLAAAVIAPPPPWGRKSVVYKTIISFNTVMQTVTLAAGPAAQETCAANAPLVNHDINPPIKYSACANCPVATITDSNQPITSIGEARDNGTHTFVPYYFARFHERVFAYTKTITLYMSLSTVNGQPPAAIDSAEARTSYTYSLSISPSIVSVPRSSTVYENTSRISRTGLVVINSGSSDESTAYVWTAPTILTVSKTDVSDLTIYASQTSTLPAIIASPASLSTSATNATDIPYSSVISNAK